MSHVTQTRFHGFLIIDKPAGWTSHDVVARLRRLTGQRQIGHAGTLDPAATGVLPVALGDATRVLEFLTDAGKTYLAEITFGVTTDTDDGTGKLLNVASVDDLNEADVEAVLGDFRGELMQVPPRYAAVRVGGRRLYELARRGEVFEPAPRPVSIYRLELARWNRPIATLLVECSKGTYIRALARDLGERLGAGAYLSNLVRLRAGPFNLCQACTIAQLEQFDLSDDWPNLAIHPDVVLEQWPALLLDDSTLHRWHNGQAVPGEQLVRATAWCRVYGGDGTWHGIGRWRADVMTWQPVKVAGAG